MPWRVIVVTAILTVAGCSGMKPYDPPDNRDNPPGRGVLSGKDGDFVIYRKRRESPPPESEAEESEAEEPTQKR
jgi:hypothetical protein